MWHWDGCVELNCEIAFASFLGHFDVALEKSVKIRFHAQTHTTRIL